MGGSPPHTTDSQPINRSPPWAMGYSPGKLPLRSALDVLRSAKNHNDANTTNQLLAGLSGSAGPHAAAAGTFVSGRYCARLALPGIAPLDGGSRLLGLETGVPSVVLVTEIERRPHLSPGVITDEQRLIGKTTGVGSAGGCPTCLPCSSRSSREPSSS